MSGPVQGAVGVVLVDPVKVFKHRGALTSSEGIERIRSDPTGTRSGPPSRARLGRGSPPLGA